MAITNRELPAGTVLVAKYRGTHHKVLVLESENGRGYELDGGTIYKSLSSAGSAVMNGVACNGWRFWTVEGEEPVADPNAPEKPRRGTKAKAEGTTTPTFKNLKKTPNQRGVPEGQARWYCSSCQKGFLAPIAETPEACPEGHAAEVADDLAPVA
jgi:hypothetical protein